MTGTRGSRLAHNRLAHTALVLVAGTCAAAGLALGALAAGTTTPAAAAARPTVREVAITGTVDPAVARLVERTVHDAASHGDDAVLVRIDTPGGLDSSMRAIVRSVNASTVPVICWIGPTGARGASAGTFIEIGCPVAAMAPGTNLGAAHPVSGTGGTLSEKITNDAAAYIRSLAEARGRNADWAERAVRKSVSISAQHALDIHVVDLLAPNVPALLDTLDGETVDTAAGPQALNVAGATIHEVSLAAGERIIHFISDADLGFLLFILGIAGIIFELIHPGLNIPGFLGLIALVLSYLVFDTLPVNVGGVILLAAAFVCFVIDIKVAAHGVPTAAGIALFVVGGLLLYHGDTAEVSRWLLISLAVFFAAFFAVVVTAALKARHAPVVTGVELLLGATAVVTRELAPRGEVRVRGEVWAATVADHGGAAAEGPQPEPEARPRPVPVGAEVRVTAREGLVLQVEALEPVPAVTAAAPQAVEPPSLEYPRDPTTNRPTEETP